MENLSVIKTVENYSLVKKGRWYYIDNGIDDVSEYFDEYDAKQFLESNDLCFVQLCKKLFN